MRASRKKASARWAPEVHSLVPVICQPPSTATALVRTLARSEPDSGSLMPIAQADLAGRDAGQESLLLLLGAVFQQRRRGLPVRDPLRGNGRADREQFLGDDEPLEEGAAAPTVPRRGWSCRSSRAAPAPGELRIPSRQPGVDTGCEHARVRSARRGTPEPRHAIRPTLPAAAPRAEPAARRHVRPRCSSSGASR